MKTILNIGKYYDPDLGGIENHMYNLCHSLKKKYRIIALTYNTKNKFEEYDDKGIHVVKVPTLLKFRSQPISLKLKSQLKKYIKLADIVHIHFPNPFAEYLCLKFHTKNLIVTYHSDITKQKVLRKLYLPILHKILEKSNSIIATSEKYARSSKVLSKYMEKVKIIPLGIDLESIPSKDSDEIDKLHRKYGSNICLFIGRLVEFKGAEYFVKAMKNCSHAVGLIIGSGPEKSNLKKIIMTERIKNVHLINHVKDRELLFQYIHSCKVLVLPSIYRNESFGIVLLEAMACSKPVITTEINSGTSYVNVDNKTGYVVPPKNSQSITSAINRILNNNESKILGTEARKRVQQHFTIEQNTKSHIKIYEALV